MGVAERDRDRALRRSLMYGLIWASTVATARLLGPGFTKLMARIKTAEKFSLHVASRTTGGIQRFHFLPLLAGSLFVCIY